MDGGITSNVWSFFKKKVRFGVTTQKKGGNFLFKFTIRAINHHFRSQKPKLGPKLFERPIV